MTQVANGTFPVVYHLGELLKQRDKMLEALVSAEHDLDWCMKHHQSPDNHLFNSIEKVRAAISAAKGK